MTVLGQRAEDLRIVPSPYLGELPFTRRTAMSREGYPGDRILLPDMP